MNSFIQYIEELHYVFSWTFPNGNLIEHNKIKPEPFNKYIREIKLKEIIVYFNLKPR